MDLAQLAYGGLRALLPGIHTRGFSHDTLNSVPSYVLQELQVGALQWRATERQYAPARQATVNHNRSDSRWCARQGVLRPTIPLAMRPNPQFRPTSGPRRKQPPSDSDRASIRGEPRSNFPEFLRLYKFYLHS